MPIRKIKERTYGFKLISFMIGLALGWLFYLFVFAIFTPEDEEIADKFCYISLILSFVTMVIYTIISDYNYLKRIEITTSSLYSNISVYKKRQNDLLLKSQDVISQFLNHESDIQKTVAQSRNDSIEKICNSKIKTLTDLKLTIEKYPDLKADKHIGNLFAQIEESENTVLNSKLTYNEYVTYYNWGMVSFPSILFSNIWKLKPLELYVDTDM